MEAISRLQILGIYIELMENQRTDEPSSTEECIADIVVNNLQTLNTERLHAEQMKDSYCRNLATQLHQKTIDSNQS